MRKAIRNIGASFLLGFSTIAIYAADNSGIQKVSPTQTARTPVVTEAWARATVPGQPVGGAYMKISSAFPVILVRVESDAARSVQVHTMQTDNGVMKMREHGPLDIPAGQMVELKPGGFHLMLLGLKQALKAGDTITLKLTFADANKQEVTSLVSAQVRHIGQPAKGGGT